MNATYKLFTSSDSHPWSLGFFFRGGLWRAPRASAVWYLAECTFVSSFVWVTHAGLWRAPGASAGGYVAEYTFVSSLCGASWRPLGAVLGPLGGQIGTKVDRKSIRKSIKILMPFGIDFWEDFGELCVPKWKQVASKILPKIDDNLGRQLFERT